MKIKHVTLLLLLTAFFIRSEYSNAQVPQVKDYKVTVKGTSSMHDWESNVEKLECKTSYKIKNNELITIEDATLKVTVRSIKSAKGKIMDNKTYDAFDSEKHPFIIFTLRSEKIDPENLTVNLTGTLEMAGITQPIDLIASYRVLTNGDFQLIGNENVKMSDYKMTPPKAMMGTIKVGDEVNITFDITFSNSASIL
jgi:polyisoprenoid-binding protein YceI